LRPGAAVIYAPVTSSEDAVCTRQQIYDVLSDPRPDIVLGDFNVDPASQNVSEDGGRHGALGSHRRDEGGVPRATHGITTALNTPRHGGTGTWNAREKRTVSRDLFFPLLADKKM
jgi:hypothetical protein